MANPQKEDGSVMIANEILEAIIRTNLTGSELRTCLYIMRKTYGFNKKQDAISISQFREAIHLSQPTIVKVLKNLQTGKVIEQVQKGGPDRSSSVWKFNKNYDEWIQVHSQEHVQKKRSTGSLKGRSLVHSGVQTKDNYIQKTNKRHKTASAVVVKKQDLINKEIKEIFGLFYSTINPMINFGNTTQRKAAETLISKVGLEKALSAVQYAISIQDQKYAPTITSPQQLLNKYGDLQAYYAKNKVKNNTINLDNL